MGVEAPSFGWFEIEVVFVVVNESIDSGWLWWLIDDDSSLSLFKWFNEELSEEI